MASVIVKKLTINYSKMYLAKNFEVQHRQFILYLNATISLGNIVDCAGYFEILIW